MVLIQISYSFDEVRFNPFASLAGKNTQSFPHSGDYILKWSGVLISERNYFNDRKVAYNNFFLLVSSV